MSETLQRDSAVPLYVQLEAVLRAKIASGELAPEQRIPSENELNRTYGVSRMTARGVLTRLVDEGTLFRVPGKGTFVSPARITTRSPAYRGVREQLEAMGYTTSTQLLDCELCTSPPAPVQARLGLADDAEVYRIRRVRSVKGEPISLHRSFVPAALAPGLDTHDVTTEQLCVVLERDFGLPMRRVEEHLSARGATAEEAEALAVATGSPVLELQDTIASASGVAFEYSEVVFNGDRLSLRFDYEL